MEILRWYSIILIVIGLLSNAFLGVKDTDNKHLISFIMLVPIFIYLILAR